MKVLMMLTIWLALAVGAAATVFAAPPGANQGSYFSSVDVDGDGYLSKDEFRDAIPQAGEEGFRYTDRDQDGKISPDEFARVPSGRGRGRGAMGRMRSGGETRFDGMDGDGDGYVSFAEFKSAFPAVGENMFMAADTDGNRKLDHAEWSRLRPKLGFGTKRGGR